MSHAGQVTLGSGLMNPVLLTENHNGHPTGWQRTRLGDRAPAIIALELAEHEYGGEHELALIAGPETKLPVSHAAKKLLAHGPTSGNSPP